MWIGRIHNWFKTGVGVFQDFAQWRSNLVFDSQRNTLKLREIKIRRHDVAATKKHTQHASVSLISYGANENRP